ncbi:MAG: hypothetical protein WC666_03900 [Candidatus Paceibacterota bacterium]|jgi:hypothetical protein
MNVLDIITETRFLTKTSTSTYSDADILREANVAYRKAMMEILKVQGYRNILETHAYTDLISTSGLTEGNNGYGGEYAFPSDLIMPKRIEVSYDGTTYRPAEIITVNSIETSATDEDDLELFNKQSPSVKIGHNSYFLYPPKTTAGDISDGIHIWYDMRQADLVDDTDTPQFETNLHDVIPLMVAKRFFMRNPDKTNTIVMSELKETMDALRSHYRIQINEKKGVRSKKINFK